MLVLHVLWNGTKIVLHILWSGNNFIGISCIMELHKLMMFYVLWSCTN